MNNIERFRGRDRFIFFLGGIFAPFIFLVVNTLFYILILLLNIIFSILSSSVNVPYIPNLPQILIVIIFFIIFFLLPIAFIIFLLNFVIRISKSQFRKYRNQGGKLSKNKVTLLAFMWWMINSIPILFFILATWNLLLLFIFGMNSS